jgi:thymidine phosphorylase
MAIAGAVLLLGAGRMNVSATVDHAVGITDLVKIGGRVRRDDRLCTVRANDAGLLDAAVRLAQTAFRISARQPAPPVLIGPLIK